MTSKCGLSRPLWDPHEKDKGTSVGLSRCDQRVGCDCGVAEPILPNMVPFTSPLIFHGVLARGVVWTQASDRGSPTASFGAITTLSLGDSFPSCGDQMGVGVNLSSPARWLHGYADAIQFPYLAGN